MRVSRYILWFLLAVLSVTSSGPPANARNLELEASLRNFNDLTDFYRAMMSTGVADELRPGQTYTVLAPTNAAFETLVKNYPCFYQPRCRDLAASFIRAHIIVGRDPVEWMVRDGRSETEGHQWVSAREPYKNEFTVNGTNVLSVGDVNNNLIYRLDGFVIPQRNLAVFRTDQLVDPSDTLVPPTMTTYLEPVIDAGRP